MLVELKGKNETQYRAMMRHLCMNDLWFLMRVVLDFWYLDEHVTGEEFVRHYIENQDRDLCFIVPRGHGKTAPMKAVLIQEILRNLKIAIMVVMADEDMCRSFGASVMDELVNNPILQDVFPELPRPSSLPKKWGGGGSWSLPGNTRRDHTLSCFGLNSRLTGLHPDLIYGDDIVDKNTNNPAGWEKARSFLTNCHGLLAGSGRIIITGTRWNDADPLGEIEKGTITGPSGKFAVLKRSCFINDDPAQGVYYPKKVRWNHSEKKGYTVEQLQEIRNQDPIFFNANYRSDPLPAEDARIEINNINIWEELPRGLGPIRAVGVEVTGGGAPIVNHMVESAEKMRLFVPWEAHSTVRAASLTKADRVVAALQPIVDSGRLWVRKDMINADDESTLGHELRRLGIAKHDDIADALHNVPVHLTRGCYPSHDGYLDTYIACDIAWTEGSRNDWTVFIAVAVDHKQNFFVLAYERFKCSSPTGVWERFLTFFSEWNITESHAMRGKKPKYLGWR